MGCVNKVVPFIVDPIGTAIHYATGGKFDLTPGGQINKALNMPKPKPKPQPVIQKPPTITMPSAPTVTMKAPPPKQPEAPRPRITHEGAPAGASSDKTKGLLKKPGVGGSLLMEE